MMVMSKPPPWAERVANPPYNYEHAFSVPLDAELNSSWWLCPSGEGDSRRWIRLLNNEEVPTVTYSFKSGDYGCMRLPNTPHDTTPP